MSAWEPILVFGGAFVIACTVGLGVIALYGFFYWIGKKAYTKLIHYRDLYADAMLRRGSITDPEPKEKPKKKSNNSSMSLDEYLQQEADKHFAQRDKYDTKK